MSPSSTENLIDDKIKSCRLNYRVGLSQNGGEGREGGAQRWRSPETRIYGEAFAKQETLYTHQLQATLVHTDASSSRLLRWRWGGKQKLYCSAFILRPDEPIMPGLLLFCQALDHAPLSRLHRRYLGIRARHESFILSLELCHT